MNIRRAGDRRKGGFTLAEMTLSTGLLMMLVLVVGMLFMKGNNLFDVLSAQSQTQRNARRIVQSVTSALRQARLSAVILPAPNQISFDLPLYQQAVGTCSAFVPPSTVTNPPISCLTNADCQPQCGAAGSMVCGNSICRRTYTYSVSSASGISQLVVSAPGEANRVVGNQVQSVTFQNRAVDPNLQANEIRVTINTNANVISEKRTHVLSLDSVVQIRN